MTNCHFDLSGNFLISSSFLMDSLSDPKVLRDLLFAVHLDYHTALLGLLLSVNSELLILTGSCLVPSYCFPQSLSLVRNILIMVHLTVDTFGFTLLVNCYFLFIVRHTI